MDSKNLLSLVQSELETVGYSANPGVGVEGEFIPADTQRVYLAICTPNAGNIQLIPKLDRGPSGLIMDITKGGDLIEFTIGDSFKLVTERINVIGKGTTLTAIGVRYKGKD